MFSEPIQSIFNQFVTISDKIMLKLTVKNSYINEILHEINDFKVQRTFVDCKLVCQGGVVQCHAAMLQYANIWWVNCRNSEIDECVIISYLSARQCLLNLETLGNVGRGHAMQAGCWEVGAIFCFYSMFTF